MLKEPPYSHQAPTNSAEWFHEWLNAGGRLLLDKGNALDSWTPIMLPPAGWPSWDEDELSNNFGPGIRNVLNDFNGINRILSNTVSLENASMTLSLDCSVIRQRLEDGAMGGIRVEGIWVLYRPYLDRLPGKAAE